MKKFNCCCPENNQDSNNLSFNIYNLEIIWITGIKPQTGANFIRST